MSIRNTYLPCLLSLIFIPTLQAFIPNNAFAEKLSQPSSRINQVSLSGKWKLDADAFWGDDRGCTKSGPGAGRFAIPEFEIIQSGNNVRSDRFGGWQKDGQGGHGNLQGTVSGNQFIAKSTNGAFTNRLEGTISRDGNTVTGRWICQYDRGSSIAEGKFSFKRISPRSLASGTVGPVTPPNPSNNSRKITLGRSGQPIFLRISEVYGKAFIKINNVVVLSTESKSGSPGFAATSIVYPPGDYKVELLIFTTEDKYIGGFFEAWFAGQPIFNYLPGSPRILRNNLPINSIFFQVTGLPFTVTPPLF